MAIKKACMILWCLLASCSHLFFAQEELPTGMILDKVVCRNNPKQSYALYLPSNYSRDKSWPILYAFDPAARGKIPAELFARAAEKLGVIVAGSNNARNGPWGPIFSAVVAMREDTRLRLSIDAKQIYAAGFSGGSRVASMFTKITGDPAAAIIACGAGLAAELTPSDIKPAFYCGLVGLEDFNYQEMVDLEEKLKEKGLPCRFLAFNGPHNWPPHEICGRALGWIVCRAMAQGPGPKEEKTFTEAFEAELGAARILEASGRILQALKDYEALLTDFQDLAKIFDLQARVDRLKASPDFAKALKKERALRQEEKRSIDAYRRILASIERDPPNVADLNRMLYDLDLNSLIKKAEQPDKPEEKALACRLLTGLESNARERGYDYYSRKDVRRSVLFFEVAVKAGSPFHTWRRIDHYNLACAHALAGNSREALANIRKAVENGLTDPGLLEKEEDFQSLRQHPDFQQILESLRKI